MGRLARFPDLIDSLDFRHHSVGDVYEAILWARDNDDKVRGIADSMVERAKRVMSQKMVLEYTHILLER